MTAAQSADEKKKLVVEWRAIGAVQPYEDNPRIIPESAVAKVAASIAEYGWQQPIVVDAAGVVIAGHTRLAAAKLIGLERVPVTVAADLSPAQVRAYRLMDNRSGQEAAWDEALLAIELGELATDDFAMELTGFTDEEIELALADDLDLPDSATIPREGGTADAGTSALVWAGFKVPMDAAESEALTARRDAYFEGNGTDYGFVGDLLGLS